MLNWPAKDPDEVKDYRINWAPKLEDGETLTASTWITADGTITIESDSIVGSHTRIWLSGGADDEQVVLTNRVETSGGRTYEDSVRLRIRSTYRP